jgi:DNA repair protein RecO (recombination protein O)
MTRVEGVHGWLLRHRPQGNTSLVLEAFTLEAGRVDLLAKGGRKNPLLQPFQPLWLNWAGQGSLPLLRQPEAAGAALLLAGMALWCGFYLNELLLRLLPRAEPVPLLFACYGSTLDALHQGEEPQQHLRRFELQLLAECGYALQLERDVQGEPLAEHTCYRLGADGLEASIQGFAGRDLLGFVKGEWNTAIARASRDLLREALARQLGPAPLKSRELMRQMQGLS